MVILNKLVVVDYHYIGEKVFSATNFAGRSVLQCNSKRTKASVSKRSENRGERTFIMLECIIRCDACVVNVFAKL